ncbi:MAG TPA: hypothetical protein VJA16_02190 [Thermoanaerobaculia bacterium]
MIASPAATAEPVTATAATTATPALATAAPPPTASLTERALLAALNIREWRGRRRDREVTESVAREHGADRNAGCYTKAIVPRDFLAAIAKVRTEARTAHCLLTLPWCDDGFRILPADLHLDYMERFRDLRARFHGAVAEFLAAYHDAKAAARTKLGSLYNDDDYPSSARLRQAFELEVKLQPLPAAGDWRLDLPAPTVERLRLDLEARLADAQRHAMGDLYRRLAAVVSRMASTLAEPDKRFRNTLVGNVRELCQLLPSLNLARDQDLASLAREIEHRLAALDPALLRLDPASRQSAAQEAAALLAAVEERLASYTGAAA